MKATSVVFLIWLASLITACNSGPGFRPEGPSWRLDSQLADTWRLRRDGIAEISVTRHAGSGRHVFVQIVLASDGPDFAQVGIRPASSTLEPGQVMGTFQRGLGWHLWPDAEPQALFLGESFTLERSFWANIELDPMMQEFDVTLRSERAETTIPVRLVLEN
jgi:hypothetical protein